MAQSIATEGIINPIEVRKVGDMYQIVTGEMRWLAAKEAKLKTIPAKILEITDEDAIFQRQMVENLQQNTMGAWETAEALKKMLSFFSKKTDHGSRGMTNLAKSIGKSPTWISDTLSILESGPEMAKKIQDGEIAKTFAIEANRAHDKIKKKLEEKIIDGEIVHSKIIPRIIKTIKENPDKEIKIMGLDFSGKTEDEVFDIVKDIAETSDDLDMRDRHFFKKLDAAVLVLDNLIDKSMFETAIKNGITESIRNTVGFRLRNLIPRLQAFVDSFDRNNN